MTTEITKFYAAKKALAEAVAVDEVKEIRDRAIGMRRYAEQAKDYQLEQDCIEIRLRAERRLGEMMAQMEKAKPVNPNPPKDRRGIENPDVVPTLAEQGIDKNLAKQARKMSKLSEPEFERVMRKRQKKEKVLRPKRDKRTKAASPQSDKVKEVVTDLVREGKPVPRTALAEEFGVSEATIQRVHNRVEGLFEREPTIRHEDLSMTAQQKLDLAIRQATRKLEAEFDQRIQRELNRALDEGGVLEAYKRDNEAAQIVIKSRKGVMDRSTFRKIWRCLHPDWVPDPDRKKAYEEAFNLFSKLELVLLNEEQMPTTNWPAMPQTREEMMKRKEEVRAARAARRQQRINEVGPHGRGY